MITALSEWAAPSVQEESAVRASMGERMSGRAGAREGFKTMAISLYDISVATYLQTLGAVEGFLEKGAAHCQANDIDLDEVVGTSLYPDMLPFSFQVMSVAHHSLGALKGVQAGLFGPPSGMSEPNYPALQKLVVEARDQLKEVVREDIDALEGRDVLFQIGGHKIPFTAENFILSFSLPNLFFHATTAYDILRMKGVPLGKRNFIGSLRIKT